MSSGRSTATLAPATSRPLRIAQVSLDGHLPRYGIGLAVVSLCRAFARRGHDVRLLCRAENARDVAPVPGLTVVPLARPAGWGPGSWAYARAVRAALAPGVDVVHVHGLTRMAWWLRGARARRGAPLVVTAHASDELGPSASAAGDAPAGRARRHARRVRAVLARADRVLTPSRFMAARVRAAGAPRVEVVPLGPTDETPAGPRAHEGFLVVALARFVPVKGLGLLLRAFAASLGAVGDARLVLAGDGPERAALEAEARALGVAGRVTFPGYVDGEARRSLLAAADVVAVPTLGAYETFGLAALDGAAAGAAVVVADGGALPERVEGGAGLVVPAGDVGAWTAALRRLHDDPTARRALASVARASVPADAWGGVAAAHASIYQSLAAHRH